MNTLAGRYPDLKPSAHPCHGDHTDPDLPAGFRETWPDRAEIAERDLLYRGQLIRRVHWDGWSPSGFAYPGPVFDRNKMVLSINQRMATTGVVGYAWAIAQNGLLVDAGGVGDARTPSEVDPRKMSETTRMVSASLAKPVCAVTIMRLVEDGQLALNDFAYPIIESAFPDAHSSMGGIRIGDLLAHKSGFDGPGKLSQFANALQQPLTWEPGTHAKYENWNYWFLAHVVEAVTGSPYVDVATDTVLAPMTITTMTREVDDDAPCLYYTENAAGGGGTWGDFTATASAPTAGSPLRSTGRSSWSFSATIRCCLGSGPISRIPMRAEM